MKKKTIKNIIKKQWLLVWITIVAVALLTIVASAEYGSTSSNMHRVVVSKKGPGMMFSSNYLIEEGDSVYHPIYVKPKDEGRYDSNYLFIWNYNTSDLERLYPEDINYRLEVKLTDQSGTDLTRDIGSRNITITNPNNETITLNNTVRSGSWASQKLVHSSQAAANRYAISFSEGWDIANEEDICVQIKAIPTSRNNNEPYTDIRTISGIVGLKTTASSVSNGWKASISEQPEENNTTVTPDQFDAYNLILTGSGSATITVRWNTAYLQLNRYFTDSNNRVYHFAEGEVIVNEPDAGGWQTMTINADTGDDTKDNRNRYTVQLYKTGSGEPVDWKFFANNKADGVYESAWIRVNIN